MTTRGKTKMDSKTFAEFFHLPKFDILKKLRFDLSSDDKSNIFFLIIYNILVSKFFNDDCFSIMDKYPSLIISLFYIITIGIYYKIINRESKEKDASNILLYFIVLILFIAVILSINTSKVGKESAFNQSITSYIYAIISFSIIFGISYIYIYIKTLKTSIKDDDFIKSLTYSLFILFGLFFFFTIINWCIVLYKTFTFTKSNVLGLFLNIAIIITLMAILFKMISYSSYYKESPFLQVTIGGLFYIPCLLISLLNKITGIYKNNKENISAGFFKMNSTDILLLIIIIVLYILYFKFTDIYTKYSSQGGNILLKEPLNTDNKKLLSSYYSLTTQEDNVHSYNYGLSSWIFIDSNNTNDKFFSIIDYGGKPNIQYRGSDNTFMITIDNKLVNGNPIKEKQNLDKLGNIIIYKNNDLLLQKWNNIVVNYEDTKVDLFVNGNLERSVSLDKSLGFSPLDQIVIGDENGIDGAICNVCYYSKPLTSFEIANYYNLLNGLNPPIII